MTQALVLLASALAGVLLGLLFFTGLWMTVRRLTTVPNPAPWMLASLLLRFGCLLAAFMLLSRYGGWQHLAAAALGFTLPRLVMVRLLRPAAGEADQ